MVEKWRALTGRERRLLLAAVIFLVPEVLLRFVPGMRFSAILCLCAAAVLVVLSVLEHGAARGSRAAVWGRRVLLALLAAGFVFFAVLEALVIRGAPSDRDDRPVQAVIVLGAGVNGETPSLALQTRIDAAERYIGEHPGIPVVLSGGQGPGERISEAECMRRALEKRGVDPNRLYLEDRSTDTRENLEYSTALLRTLGFEERGEENPDGGCVAVVTNDFHLFRVSLLGGPGLRVVGVPARLPWLHLTVNYYIREAFAVAELLVFGG